MRLQISITLSGYFGIKARRAVYVENANVVF